MQHSTKAELTATNYETNFKNSSYGWQGITTATINGHYWMMSTMRSYSGIIRTHCHIVNNEGGGSYSFMMFEEKNPNEEFYLNVQPKGTRATENRIKEVHLKSIQDMKEKEANGELPNKEAEYKVEIGQVLFTHMSENENRRAVYEIMDGGRYKTVLIDGSNTTTDDYVRNYTKKFGIGVYFEEGDVITPQEVAELLPIAIKNRELKEVARQESAKIQAQKDENKRIYLSQFTLADRRTTSTLIKKHILETFPTVSKVECKSDSYSGGDSFNLTYYAPEEIEEVECLIKSMRYGSFDAMTDSYDYDSNREKVIVQNHILQSYKYSTCNFVQSDNVRPEKTSATESIRGEFILILNTKGQITKKYLPKN